MLLLILVQLYGVTGFLCVDKAWPFFLELLYFPFQTYHKFILLLNAYLVIRRFDNVCSVLLLNGHVNIRNQLPNLPSCNGFHLNPHP